MESPTEESSLIQDRSRELRFGVHSVPRVAACQIVRKAELAPQCFGLQTFTLDTFDAIATKLDVREFAAKHVPKEIKQKILEAARLTGSSMNSQHWRFIVIQDQRNLKTLASDSTTGTWVGDADFAILILTNPRQPGFMIDAGRVLQDMELAAWNFGIVSRLYTGIKDDEVRRDFGVPAELKPTAVLGFGYPKQKVSGRKKNRKAIQELAFSERFGNDLDLK